MLQIRQMITTSSSVRLDTYTLLDLHVPDSTDKLLDLHVTDKLLDLH